MYIQSLSTLNPHLLRGYKQRREGLLSALLLFLRKAFLGGMAPSRQKLLMQTHKE